MVELRRTYEVSIWTLQDEFISVLKPLNVENKNMIENKEFKINSSDINKYSFSIPMYIYQGAERIINPIWHNTINGDIIANLRKIKVILNKSTEDEEVYEFLIVKVEERHEKDQLFCDVTCEDMAFHELGKIGYKISLSSDNFYLEDDEWFKAGANPLTEPHATLQYWNDKFLSTVPEQPSSNEWYYQIQMDWACYSSSALRAEDKIYEEEYVSSWDNDLQPIDIVGIKEKERLVDIEESNIYNITQQLAETFNVFVKYKYLYDINYHIIGRRIIYYNNFAEEKNGYYGITYPYDASKIVRTLDAIDVSTKMFVRPTDNQASESGLITILDVDANKTKEDYILNFDYLRAIGAITTEQIEAIEEYERQMHDCNVAITNLDNQILVLDENLQEYRAKITLFTNAIALDKERITAADDLLNNLDIKDEDADGAITIASNNPASGIMIQSKKLGDTSYYINLSVGGILPETLKIYTDYNFSTQTLSNQLTGVLEYDEFGNLVRVTNLYPRSQASKHVYMIYKYKPKLQYEQVKQTWQARLAKDQEDLVAAQTIYENNLALRTAANNSRILWIATKNKYISDFEKMMGPALRESYWQPDDYNDYGDKYVDTYIISTNASINATGTSTHSSLIWDDELFDDEQKTTYKIGIEETIHYFPCIDLSDHLEYISNNINSISFMYYDYIENSANPYEAKNIKSYAVGSGCQLGFVNINNTVTPVLILTFASSLSNEQLNRLVNSNHLPQIGVLKTTVSGQTINIDIESSFSADNLWIMAAETPIYPRIKIDSLNILIGDNDLGISCGGSNLTKYIDYYLLSKIDGCYYITIRPEVLFRHSTFTSTVCCKFVLSNASTSIYLDSIEVLRENAFPKVSYSLDPGIINKDLMYITYKLLNQIININDTDLKLKNVQGYVSAISLNLDSPWLDKIEIKNYKNKFEDLFSSIVAQTEAMKKNERAINTIGVIFDSRDGINESVLQESMLKADLNYAFNNGKLTIDEENGIWGLSDNGVVAFRGGGIFTSTQKDEDGNWIWNTGIIPEGINADLITTGQLDTNKIRVFAGDKVRFQLNGDGLFAFKSFLEDNGFTTLTPEARQKIQAAMAANVLNGKVEDLDAKQYVKLDQNGLFLIAEEDAYILNSAHTDYIRPASKIARVEISWYGLKLRNWDGKEVFFADADTGNLTLEGTLYATNLYIGERGGSNTSTINNYINTQINDNPTIANLGSSIEELQQQIDGSIDTWFLNGEPQPTSATAIGRLSTDLETEWGLTSWNPTTGYSPADLNIILRHNADMYYDIDNDSPTAGQAWRFIIITDDGSIQSYHWENIPDTAAAQALAAARAAQETADKKITTYYAAEQSGTIAPDLNNITPSEGDLWINTSKDKALYRYENNQWILASNTISQVDVEYGVSDSSTTAPISWSTSAPVWSTGKYVWQRTKIIKNGIISYEPSINGVCIQAAGARLITISGQQIVVVDNSNNTPSYNPTSITLTASCENLTVKQWYYRNSSNQWIAISGATNPSYVVATSSGAWWIDNRATFKVTATVDESNYYDTYTIVRVQDGLNGNDAAITFLTNESVGVITNENNSVEGAKTYYSNLVAYVGTQKTTPIISSITPDVARSGITCVQNSAINSEIPLTLSFANNTVLSASTGYFNINITSPVQITLKLCWNRMNSAVANSFKIEPSRTVFSEENTTNITLTGKFYHGNNLVSEGATYSWTSVPSGITSTNSSITVARTDVNGTRTFICTSTYLGTTYTDSITIQDKTDPITCEILSTAGDKFTNGVLETYLLCRVYNSKQEIDMQGTEYIYTWTNSNGALTAANYIQSAPTILNGYGVGNHKIIKVTHTDVTNKAIFNCSIEKVS